MNTAPTDEGCEGVPDAEIEYQAWIDFYRDGKGDYDAFLVSDEYKELRANDAALRGIHRAMNGSR